MKITIRKIAELAGVSRGTVDRVLNNRAGVNPDVKEKILKIIDTIDYRPNKAAKALALNHRPLMIGIVLPPKDALFFDDVLIGINQAYNELKDFGIKVEVRQVDNKNPGEALQAIEEFVIKGASGLAVSVMNNEAVRNKLLSVSNSSIPVVTFNSDIDNCGRLCFVGQDVYKSGVVAASLMNKIIPHCSELLAVTGNMEFQAHNARIKGFMDFYKQAASKNMVVEILECYENYEITLKKLLKAFSSHPSVSGVFMATGSIKACIDALKITGLAGKVHIVCNDLLPEISDSLKDGLIDFTICQDPVKQGYLPVKLLYDFIVGGIKPNNEHIFTGIEIKIRESM